MGLISLYAKYWSFVLSTSKRWDQMRILPPALCMACYLFTLALPQCNGKNGKILFAFTSIDLKYLFMHCEWQENINVLN